MTMQFAEALSFVRQHGVVLISAKGPIPRMTEIIAGEPISGSWWAHRHGRQIFTVLRKLGDSPEVLVCRLVNEHVTLVHRRLWPALVRAASRFAPEQLARVHEQHTASGRHVNQAIAYPNWVPPDVIDAARSLTEPMAINLLGPDIMAMGKAVKPSRRQRRS